MKRKHFIRDSVLGLAAFAVGTKREKATNKSKSANDKLHKQVGFNHLPIKENKNMNYIIHKANTRGHANHGWLDSHHSFSFASYYNPDRMNFGVLRVLNDDIVAEGKGFGTHPHDNMEIISIPLEGELEHRDSMGNTTVIKEGEIQVMSAGSGIRHSEFNKSQEKAVKFLQIWLFPHTKNVKPRYDQIKINTQADVFQQILSPYPEDEGVWIHQDAWFHIGRFTKEMPQNYRLKNKENGLYLFVIEGGARVNQEVLSKRDALGIWDVSEIEIHPAKNSYLLLMELPMKNQ